MSTPSAAGDGQPSLSSAQSGTRPEATIAGFQRLIREMYGEKDATRGVEGTFMWFMEEVGELSSCLRHGTHEERLGEFADVFAWLTTLANLAGIDLTAAVERKYGQGCPGCGQFVCTCAGAEKP